MSGLTNAQLAQQVSALVAYWRTRDLEFQGWLSGTATGGPFADGRYPLTDYLNNTAYVKSPAALQASVDGIVNSASSHASAASNSASAASAAQSAAEAARDLALTYRNAAQSARDLALSYRDQAANSAANAQALYNAMLPDAPSDGFLYGRRDGAWQVLSIDAATIPWANITGKPSTFAPDAHGHVIADITGLQSALNAKADISGLSAYASLSGANVFTSGLNRIQSTNAALQFWKDSTPSLAGRVGFNTGIGNALSLDVYNGSTWLTGLWVDTGRAVGIPRNLIVGTYASGTDQVLTLEGSNPYMAWQINGSRKGYFQFTSDTNAYLVNEVGPLRLYAGNTQTLSLFPGAAYLYDTDGTFIAHAFDGSGYYSEVSGGKRWRIYTGGAERVRLESTGNMTLWKPLRVATLGNGVDARTVVFHDATNAPIPFGSYAGSWRSALQLDGNSGTSLLFLAPPDPETGSNAFIRAANGALSIITGGTTANGGTTNATFDTNGYTYFNSWLRVGDGYGLFTPQSQYWYPVGSYWYGQGSSATQGGIRLLDVNGNSKMYAAYWDADGYGLLSAGGSWALRLGGTAGFELKSNLGEYSYGAAYINGARNGYCGLVLNVTGAPAFMSSGGATGVYFNGHSRWSFYDDGSATGGYFRVYAKIIDEQTTYPYLRNTFGSAAGGLVSAQAGGTPSGGNDGDIVFIY